MNVVFDTNILISATLWDNSESQKLLFSLIRKDVMIFSSKEILDEYKRILVRDFGYSDVELAKILEKVICFLNLIEPKTKVSVVKEDVDDNKIIECAIECKADYVISYDKHLLKIKEYAGIRIVKPEGCLF